MTRTTEGAAPALRVALAAILLAGALLWPAVVNRAPILFPDSVGYFRSGEASLDAVGRLVMPAARASQSAPPPLQIDTRGDGVSTQRSVYYGTVVAAQQRLGGTWLVVATQCLAVALTLVLALRLLGVPGLRNQIVLAAVLALPGGLAIFSSTVMPDVYLGLMLLSLGLLFAYGEAMTWRDRLWFFAVVAAAVLFHKAHLAVAAGVIGLSVLLLLFLRRPWLRTTLSLAAILAAATVAHGVVDTVVLRVSGHAPVATPFLLARLVGDGTAERYLDKHCPTQPLLTCQFRSRMPMSENTFLWSNDPQHGGFGAMGAAQRAKVSAEEKTIVLGTVREFPVAQALASTRNAVAQFFVVGATEFQRQVGTALSPHSSTTPTIDAYRSSEIAHHEMPLVALSWIMAATYFLSLLAVIAVGAVQFRTARPRSSDGERWPRFWIAFAIVAMGLVVNAAACGVLSGVFDRYQGRAAWLAPLFALAAAMRLLQDRGAALAQPA